MKTFAALLGAIGWLWSTDVPAADSNAAPRLELHVRNVVYSPESRSPVVVLVDKEEKRFLPIWIGFGEAHAIAMELYGIKPPRPMTHDLIRSLVAELDGKVDNLVITEIKANTYHANLTVTAHGETKRIDCRPSDGIAVALRTKSPILVDEAVMANALPIPEEARQLDAQSIDRLGITAQTLTPDLAAAFGYGNARGALVTNSGRDEIQRGDVIVALGDVVVASVTDLNAALEKAKAGTKVRLRILRNANEIPVETTLKAD